MSQFDKGSHRGPEDNSAEVWMQTPDALTARLQQDAYYQSHAYQPGQYSSGQDQNLTQYGFPSGPVIGYGNGFQSGEPTDTSNAGYGQRNQSYGDGMYGVGNGYQSTNYGQAALASSQFIEQLNQVDPTMAAALADAAPQMSLNGLLATESVIAQNYNSGSPVDDATLMSMIAQQPQWSPGDIGVITQVILPDLGIPTNEWPIPQDNGPSEVPNSTSNGDGPVPSSEPGAGGDGSGGGGTASKLSPLEQSEQNINSAGVDQRGHGDCVYEATLAAIAGSPGGPAIIKNAIKDNGDGTYTVTFPGDSSKPVTVNQDDLSDSKIGDSQLWAKIMEAAFAKGYPKAAEGDYPKDVPGGTDGKPPTPAQYAMYLMTGNTAPFTDASSKDIGDKVQQALDNGQPVVAFCKDDDNKALVSGHEWTVEKYDPSTGTITLRNPWGGTPSSDASKSGITVTDDGQVQMSLQTFQKYYGEVTFGTAA